MRWWPSAPTPSGASASQTRSAQTPALCSAPAAGPAHTTVTLFDNATSQTGLAIYFLDKHAWMRPLFSCPESACSHTAYVHLEEP